MAEIIPASPSNKLGSVSSIRDDSSSSSNIPDTSPVVVVPTVPATEVLTHEEEDSKNVSTTKSTEN